MVQLDTIKKISNKFNLSEGEAKKLVDRIINLNSKPSLTNIDCPLDIGGIGPSDKA